MARWRITSLKKGGDKNVISIKASQLTPPLESQIQITIIEWADSVRYKGSPLSLYIHHSPNGGTRDGREAERFKAMGTRAGYPDLTIDIAKGGYHGMRLELKRTNKEKPSEKQITALDRLREEGYYAVVCCGFDDSVNEINRYIKGLIIRSNQA